MNLDGNSIPNDIEKDKFNPCLHERLNLRLRYSVVIKNLFLDWNLFQIRIPTLFFWTILPLT